MKSMGLMKYSPTILVVLMFLTGCGGGGGGNVKLTQYQDIYDGAATGYKVCGDNVVDEQELCDDGNKANGDGCSSACMIEFRDFGWSKWLGRNGERSASQEEDAFGNIMETTFISINSVSYSTPSSGQIVNVIANFSIEDDEETATIMSAKLIYSINGGSETVIDMKYSNGAAWIGTIPAQTSKTNVKFYIWAADSNGNVTTGGISSSYNLVPGVPDIDNSANIVGDDLDITNIAVNYDAKYIYLAYEVEGEVTEGTIESAFLHYYMVKFTNPDVDSGEGLMVGKWFFNTPYYKNEEIHDELIQEFLEQGAGYIEQMGEENIDRMFDTGLYVYDLQELMRGNVLEGILFNAAPEGKSTKGVFYGKIKRWPLGENPSEQMRLIFFTMANASLDSFMPMPLNCSNFLTIYFSNYEYTVN